MISNNFAHLSKSITEPHVNFVIEEVNDHCMRMAVMEEKTFPWHSHPDSDELFVILEGQLIIEFKDQPLVKLGPGDFYKVKSGMIHRTIAVGRTVNLCFETKVANTVFFEN